MTDITVYVTVKHTPSEDDPDTRVGAPFGAFNTLKAATDAITATLELDRQSLGLPALTDGRMDRVFVDDEAEIDDGIITVYALDLDVHFSLLKTVLR